MLKGLQGGTHLCEKLSYERNCTDSGYSKRLLYTSFFRSFLTIRLILVEAVPVIVRSVDDSIPAPLNEKRPFFRPLKSGLVAYIPDGKER